MRNTASVSETALTLIISVNGENKRGCSLSSACVSLQSMVALQHLNTGPREYMCDACVGAY